MESHRLQVRQNTVIPAQAGIQTEEFNPDSLDPCLRRGDGKTELANGVRLGPRGLQSSKQPPPLPLGEGRGEGKYVIFVGLPPHPNPLPKGRGDFAILLVRLGLRSSPGSFLR